MTVCTFRTAVPGDEELILSFIRALADYEHMSDQVVATPELLREWIFEKQKAEVIFAAAGGREVGFALFFHNFSTFLGRAGIYLEDLFVLPEERGKGYGEALLKRLAVSRWNVGAGGWNGPAWTGTPLLLTFISKRCAATPMDEWTTYRLTGERLKQAAE